MPEEERMGFWERLDGPLTDEDRRKVRGVNALLFGWQVAFIGGLFLIAEEVIGGVAASGVIVAVAVLGLFSINVYRRFILAGDELMRRIQLHSMAIGFGLAVVGGETLEMVAQATGWAIPQVATMMIATLGYTATYITMTHRYA